MAKTITFQQVIQQYISEPKWADQFNLRDFFTTNFQSITSNRKEIELMFEFVPVQEHALVYMWLLHMYIVCSKANDANLQEIQKRINILCSLEVLPKMTNDKKSLVKFQELSTIYSEFLIACKKPMYGISVLIKSIKILKASSEQTSTAHTNCAKLCLKAKCYQHALKFIDNPITSYMEGTSAIDIMVYNYYRGMIFTGLKRYQDAINCFRAVLTQPTKIIHKVHLESYKKCTLLNLIQHGEEFQMPQSTAQMVQQKVNLHTDLYRHISDAYSGDQGVAALEQLAMVETNMSKLQADNNWGLLKKVIQRLTHKKIKDLTEVYLTLGFDEIINKQKALKTASEVQQMIETMVAEGQTKARINQQDKTVEFQDQSAASSSGSGTGADSETLHLIDQLERQNQRIVQLMNKVNKLDRGIQLSKQFISKSLNNESKNAQQDDARGGDEEMIQT